MLNNLKFGFHFQISHLGGLPPGGAVVDVDPHGARLDPPLDLALPLREEARRADDQGRLRTDESLYKKKSY